MVAQVSKKQTEIKSAVVFRCTCKTSGEIFYAVPSDSTNETYKVTYNAEAHRYECNCPACVECKHVRAVRSVVLAKAEIAKQGNTSPAMTEQTHRVSRVDGICTKWYPEYRQGAEWFRYPQPDGNQAASFVIEGRAEQWLAERIASVAEQAAERKMNTFKQAMEVEETRASYMRHFYDEY